MSGDGGHRITSLAVLDALYGAPQKRSVIKETARITAEYRRLIEASPFLVLASAGPEGLDCSPRGDAPPIATVIDDATLAIPDRPGNNRIDSLRNIVRDPRVGLLFLIPGVGETLRVNGRAAISVAEADRQRFAVDGKQPKSVILVSIDTVYFQCARAVLRSGLWDPARHVDRASLPTCGEMLSAIDSECGGASYDSELLERQLRTLF